MKLILLPMALIAVALTACGGGSDVRDTDLEDQLAKAETALERERRERMEAEQELRDAEQELRDAEQERDTAEGQRDTAQQEVTDAEDQARQAEEERDEAQQILDRFIALEVVTSTPENIAKGSITVPALSYQKPALVTVPDAQFTSTGTGSSRGWFKTTRSGSSQQRRDFAEIFSNVEAPAREDFRDHALGASLTYNERGIVRGQDNHINITTDLHGMLAASSRFPRPSTRPQGEKETFTVTDRGPTQDQKNAARAAKTAIDMLNNDADPYDTSLPDYRLRVREMELYPERYSVDIDGTLQGAPGNFRCAGDAMGGTCSVDISGPDDYIFEMTDAEWQFIPDSATSQVIIADAQYMWFGWWMREPFETAPNTENAIFDLASSYGGLGGSDNVAQATGTATYEGAAIGHYAFYDIEAAEDDRSRSGRFEAEATLIADFDAESGVGTLSGSITEFDTEPTWSVTLKSQTIASGGVMAVDDSVSWSIRGLPRDGGQWEAKFYSNFVEPAPTASPTGVAGAFTAQYGNHRRMIGAFGAERD